MKPTKVGTVALIVRMQGDAPVLVDTLSDDNEIAAFESALQQGSSEPLETVYEMRARQVKEDEEFGNYVEELLSQPFVRREIQEHGVQWLRSKIRIEQFQKKEAEATKTIAEYALRVFRENREATDFLLAGPAAKVRVRVFAIEVSSGQQKDPNAA